MIIANLQWIIVIDVFCICKNCWWQSTSKRIINLRNERYCYKRLDDHLQCWLLCKSENEREYCYYRASTLHKTEQNIYESRATLLLRRILSFQECQHLYRVLKIALQIELEQYAAYYANECLLERKWLVHIITTFKKILRPKERHAELNRKDKYTLLNAEAKLNWRARLSHVRRYCQIVDVYGYVDFLPKEVVVFYDPDSLLRPQLF